MSFKIERFNNINDFTAELERAANLLPTDETLTEKSIAQKQIEEKVNRVDALLKNNWDLLIDKTQDLKLREKLFVNLDKLARDLDNTESKTVVVDKLIRKISLCITTFAPAITGFSTDNKRALFPIEISTYILENLPADNAQFKASLKTLKSLRATSPEIANTALARWINQNKIQMINVFDKSLNELEGIFPFLEYANLEGLFLNDKELETFASKCQELKILKLDSSAITKLPISESLAATLKELHCKFCMELKTLPQNYSQLEEFHYKKCGFREEELTNLPAACQIYVYL